MIRQQPTWYLALITLLTIGLDQFTKYLIVSNLVLGESWMPWNWLAPIVTITHVHNSGAAFGIFPAGGIVFAVIGVIVVGAIIYYFHQLPRGQWLARTALSLQLGGAIGNLTDRFRQGHVTDFINFEYFPVFNVADSAIVVGVSLLVVLMAIEERREAKLKAESESDEAAFIGVERDAIGSVEHPDSTTP